MKVFIQALSASIVATILCTQGAVAAGNGQSPRTVGRDPVGDWGSNVHSALGPLGEPSGLDLTEALISREGQDFIFTFVLSSLPSDQPLPLSAYRWSFTINREVPDVSWHEIRQAAPDPSGQILFQVLNCATADTTTPVGGVSTNACEEAGAVPAKVDAGVGTISVAFPIDMLATKKVKRINPGGHLATSSGVSVNGGGTPEDELLTDRAFIVR